MRAKAYRLAKRLGVTIDESRLGRYLDIHVQAPAGFHFRNNGTHVLVTSTAAGVAAWTLEAWTDVVERLDGESLEPCPHGATCEEDGH